MCAITVRKTKNNIVGIVIPAEWDGTGKVIEVAVSTPEENIRLMENMVTKAELLQLIHKEVEFIGLVKGKDTHQKIMLVDQYRLKKSWQE